MIWFLVGFFYTGYVVLKALKMVFWHPEVPASSVVADVSLEEYMYGTAYDDEVELIEEERRSERLSSSEQ